MVSLYFCMGKEKIFVLVHWRSRSESAHTRMLQESTLGFTEWSSRGSLGSAHEVKVHAPEIRKSQNQVPTGNGKIVSRPSPFKLL